MSDAWTDRWNERYRQEAFAYGEEPNAFLKEQLTQLNPGTILFPAEGEGRNAVFAAKQGWQVSAFDISEAGKSKALRLAEVNQVSLDYRVALLKDLPYTPGQFDALAFIYAHFPADIKSVYHQTLSRYLRPGGTVIFEAFSKRHLDYIARDEKVGGPQDLGMLFSVDEIKFDFPSYDVLILEEKEIILQEGLYHNGLGSVIRFVGRKK